MHSKPVTRKSTNKRLDSQKPGRQLIHSKRSKKLRSHLSIPFTCCFGGGATGKGGNTVTCSVDFSNDAEDDIADRVDKKTVEKKKKKKQKNDNINAVEDSKHE